MSDPSETSSESVFADLTGQTALVTGSSNGIGRAIAIELAQAGAAVIIHCRQSRESADAVHAEIRAFGGTAAILQSDLGQPSQLEEFAEQAWNCFSGVDHWVNNAGADLLTGADAELAYADKLQRLFEVDIRSTLILSRLSARRMRAAGHGTILNVGWDQADRGMDGDSGELFATAKNAIMGATRSLALSYAPQVRVNCIAPGWIRTAWGEQASDTWQQRVLDETPLRRWGSPEDVARMARFLLSPSAAYITGQVIRVNGGAER
ncbi:MAG: SDR family NAD(P)-dependent oxidoreductase [Planctomycetaceae bacterium]